MDRPLHSYIAIYYGLMMMIMIMMVEDGDSEVRGIVWSESGSLPTKIILLIIIISHSYLLLLLQLLLPSHFTPP